MGIGYAGKILKLNLGSGRANVTPTSQYAEKLIGGRGFAARIYWDEVPPQIGAFDPDNCLIIVTGPLAGFSGLAGSRTQICSKSPNTVSETFSYASLGGSWGVELKLAGYDGIVIQGKSETPVYIFINDDRVEIKDAANFWGNTPFETKEFLEKELGFSVKVLSIGLAGENLVNFSTIVSDEGSTASSGFGAVMGSKKLKAIVVRGTGKVVAAYPDRLQEAREQVRRVARDRTITPPNFPLPKKRNACAGCISGCLRTVAEAPDGQISKAMCQAAGFYMGPSMRYYKKPTDVPALANRLCNSYGVDTMVIEAIIIWLFRCHLAGIITDEEANIPISNYGSSEFIEAVIENISLRRGFGDILAQGIVTAAAAVGNEAEDLVGDLIFPPTGEVYVYDPRMYITTAIFYATEPKRPISQLHEISMPLLHWHAWYEGIDHAYISTETMRALADKFWGGEIAADFSTYEGKALAAKMIQDRQYAYECLTLCNYSWPIAHVRYSADHVGDANVESLILSAIIGRDIDKDSLYWIGEKVFNLQRGILIREGWRERRCDDIAEFNYAMPLKYAEYKPECRFNREFLLPGNLGQVISKKGVTLDRGKFTSMKEEYYRLRGWDMKTGLQTKILLQKLGLEDIGNQLEMLGQTA